MTDLARALLEIQHAAYAVEAFLIQDDRIPPLHEDAHDLCSAALTWLGAFNNGRLVGGAAYVEAADQFEIDRLMVAPSAHRAGVGTALIREVLERAGPKRTIVSTGRANAPARSLYEGLGFAEFGEQEAVPGLWVTRYAYQSDSWTCLSAGPRPSTARAQPPTPEQR